MDIHLSQEFCIDWITGVRADYGIDATARTNGCLSDAFPIIYPFLNFRTLKNRTTVKTPAFLAA